MSSVHELAGRVVGLRDEQESMVRDLGTWRGSASGCRVRSFYDAGAWTLQLDVGAAPLEIFELTDLDAGDLLEVQLAELELLHDGHPRLARVAPRQRQIEAVFVDRPTSSWAAWLPCHGCGGYRLKLPFSAHRFIVDPDSTEARIELELAREAALVLLGRFAGAACPGCNGARVRSGDVDLAAEGVPMVWLDVLGPDPGWQLWLPLEGSPAGVTLPLGLPAWSAQDEVDAAAEILASSGRAEGRSGVRVYDWEEGDDELEDD